MKKRLNGKLLTHFEIVVQRAQAADDMEKRIAELEQERARLMSSAQLVAVAKKRESCQHLYLVKTVSWCGDCGYLIALDSESPHELLNRNKPIKKKKAKP